MGSDVLDDGLNTIFVFNEKLSSLNRTEFFYVIWYETLWVSYMKNVENLHLRV